MNRSTHKTADLWPAHMHQTFCLHVVYLLSTYDVTSHTRPSHFSACNIKNLGMGLGTRLVQVCTQHLDVTVHSTRTKCSMAVHQTFHESRVWPRRKTSYFKLGYVTVILAEKQQDKMCLCVCVVHCTLVLTCAIAPLLITLQRRFCFTNYSLTNCCCRWFPQ